MRKWFCLLMMTVLLLGLTVAPAWGKLAEPYASGGKELPFRSMTISCAGASDVNYASGEYFSAQEALTDDDRMNMTPAFLKTQVMVHATLLFVPDETVGFFIPTNAGGTHHELTLYGKQDIDPDAISFSGLTVTGKIEKHVFGDADSLGNDGRLYWYTMPVTIPAADTELKIYVSGELFVTADLIHVGGAPPVSLMTTMQVYDYEEGVPNETIRSMTLRVSGIALPDSPSRYSYTWSELVDPEEGLYDSKSAHPTTVSTEDEFGYRLLTFDFGEGVPSQNLLWGMLSFADESGEEYPAYFFSYGHLMHPGSESRPRFIFISSYAYYDDPYYALGGTFCDVPTPYYCIYKEPGGAALPGDVNGDGEVNAADLTALARHVARIEVITDAALLANADVTGEGDVTAADLTKLARYVARIISEL